jgi:hypothetical protein
VILFFVHILIAILIWFWLICHPNKMDPLNKQQQRKNVERLLMRGGNRQLCSELPRWVLPWRQDAEMAIEKPARNASFFVASLSKTQQSSTPSQPQHTYITMSDSEHSEVEVEEPVAPVKGKKVLQCTECCLHRVLVVA